MLSDQVIDVILIDLAGVAEERQLAFIVLQRGALELKSVNRSAIPLLGVVGADLLGMQICQGIFNLPTKRGRQRRRAVDNLEQPGRIIGVRPAFRQESLKKEWLELSRLVSTCTRSLERLISIYLRQAILSQLQSLKGQSQVGIRYLFAILNRLCEGERPLVVRLCALVVMGLVH